MLDNVKYIFNRFQIKEGRWRRCCIVWEENVKLVWDSKNWVRQGKRVMWSEVRSGSPMLYSSWSVKEHDQRKQGRDKNESRPGPDLRGGASQIILRDNEEDVSEERRPCYPWDNRTSSPSVTRPVNNEIKKNTEGLWCEYYWLIVWRKAACNGWYKTNVKWG